MKTIKILIFFIIFTFLNITFADNVPLWYWGANFNKTINDININHDMPIWFIGINITKIKPIEGIMYNNNLWFIWTNFNKRLTYTWFINQTPVWFMWNYKWKDLILPKLNKIIYEKELIIKNNNIGNSNISIWITNIWIINTGSLIVNNVEVTNTWITNTGSWIIDKTWILIKNNKILEEKNKKDLLIKNIGLAKKEGNIYTYRLREYIKNIDWSFTNIDTLRPYTWNINHLKKKITPKEGTNVLAVNTINSTDSNTNNNIKNDSNISILDNVTIKNNSLLDNTWNVNNASSVNNKVDIIKKQDNIKSNYYDNNTKILEEKLKKDILINRIEIAKSNNEIYTYRLRRYIRNYDWTFTNIDTLRKYGWNVSSLKKESELELIKKINKSKYNSKKIQNKTKITYKNSKKSTKNSNSVKTSTKKSDNKNNISYIKETFKLKNRQLFEDMIHVYFIKKKLRDIKQNDINNYKLINNCFIWKKCKNKTYFNKIRNDINNSINIEYLAKRLNVDLKYDKILNYREMLVWIFKIYLEDKYFNLNISEKKFSKTIDILLSNILKGYEKQSYNKVDFLSYKRIYYSLLESEVFLDKIETLLYKI